MPGTDVYSNVTVGSGSWSDTVGYTPAVGTTPASVQVGGVAASDVVLNGNVATVGDTVTITFNSLGQMVQEQLRAVCDILGGSLFTDSAGDYFLFSDGALTQGDSYSAVSGFGFFSAGQPNAACFAAGTLIDTVDGPVAIEALCPGDRVRALLRAAAGGGYAPVIWTGRMQIACARHPDPASVWPVRVAAGAFGPGRPLRDLYLSPDHAVYDHGALVPIRHLLNDATIAQVPVDHVTYWHVELPAHDVLLAEGLGAESYLDTGNRRCFSSTAAAVGGAPVRSVVPIGPAAAGGLADRVWAQQGCARLLTADAQLAPLRRRLREHARIAGWRETGDAGLQLLAGDRTPLGGAWDGLVATASIPPGCAAIRLHSRSAVPCLLGDGSTDGRRLGVAVTRLRIDGREIRLDDARMRDGWHAMEAGWRWTDGAAAIPLTPMRQARSVEIHTAPMLAYWQAPALAEAAQRAA